LPPELDYALRRRRPRGARNGEHLPRFTERDYPFRLKLKAKRRDGLCEFLLFALALARICSTGFFATRRTDQRVCRRIIASRIATEREED